MADARIGFAVTGTSLRRSTSSQGETVASVRAGDALYITGESGSYYIVEYEGKLGYVAKSSVRVDSQIEANTPSQAAADRYAADGGIAGQADDPGMDEDEGRPDGTEPARERPGHADRPARKEG